ncbi:MAG: hypothetical protein HQ528_02160 [Candidatus Marinimicrobia bacterium]|nr:hypothetical protein [Candidatus Neomarinimicrobiota bacterium]
MAFKLLPTRQQLGLIIGSFLLAFLLWLFVSSQKEFTTDLEVTIEVRNIQAMKTLRQEIPRTANVRFRGTGRALLEAILLKNILDLKLVVDLERIQTDYEFVLNDYYERYPQKIDIPSTFDITYIEVVYPRTLHIALDDIMVKKVPVIQEIIVDPAPGHLILGGPVLAPAEVEISGPKELLKDIDRVYLPKDTLLNLDEPVKRRYELETLNRLINVSEPEILYSLDVQAIGERIITDVPVSVINILPNLRVFVNPATVSLTITGGIKQIAGVKPDDIGVVIDFRRQWNPRQQFYEPVVSLNSSFLTWRDLSPRNLELVATKELD